MANKMEHHHTDIRRYTCACGTGHYEKRFVTNKDDYLHEEFKTGYRLVCTACEKTYLIEDGELVPIGAVEQTARVSSTLDACCNKITAYAAAHHKAEILEFIKSVPMSRLYSMWKIGSPALQTFRNKLKQMGYEDTYRRYLVGSHIWNVQRLMATVQACGIPDPQLEAWFVEANDLERDLTSAKQAQKRQAFQGKFIDERRTWSDAEGGL
ncbi:hypothetical protein ACFSR7_05975 [Cohnella sp. GCM10020058]|uniref:hypothetical protein n=1 Tax=Cohnella sp. GCM10020058 TaxID=3317330 RepID=UPI0036457564